VSRAARRRLQGAPRLLVCLALCACSGLRDDLRRAEAAFVEARYEDVSAWLADLEPNVTDLPRPLRARYYYMAGVTAERLGDRANALHYLLLCREEAQREGNGLSDDRRRNLALTLAELSREPAAPATSGSP
jgi:hypothetical protein